MKGTQLSVMLATIPIVIMISTAITIATLSLLQQYLQTVQAFPCIGNSGKGYCVGYHDGAVQAHRDYGNGSITFYIRS